MKQEINIPIIKSISEVNYCYQTQGSRPVRILCDDLEYYVCKYYTGNSGPAYALFNELFAASLLKIWEIPAPDYAIITVEKDHILNTGYPYHYFKYPCFGSKFQSNAKEVDKIFMGMQKSKISNFNTAYTYLLIALFDMWLSNEDRHNENFNLLFDIHNSSFIPIDHVCIFNSNSIDKEPYLISTNESILSSPLFSRFFFAPLKPEQEVLRYKIEEDFKNHLDKCHEKLPHILTSIPPKWQVDIPFIQSRLEHFFSDYWINKTLKHFFDIFNSNFKKLKL